MITYHIGGIELVDRIEPMWNKLKEHHSKTSTYFGDEMSQIPYALRKKAFYVEGKQIYAIIATDNDTDIGYCIASIQNNKGEIESIFVDNNYRSHNIGYKLMEKSLDYLSDKDIKDVDIFVAVGNESAYKFYEKFGFYPRVTKLKRKSRE